MIPVVDAEVLNGYCAGQLERAAASLWPGQEVVLGGHAPSVTGYVQQITVGGRPLFAKCSLLGVSLVSVMRGSCGSWEKVKTQQSAYGTLPTSLLAREAAQLDALAAGGLAAARAAGCGGGVLFTVPVTGPTLADLVFKSPERAGELLTRTLGALEVLQRPVVAEQADRSAITERGIDATFRRKFNGISGRAYLDQLGDARLDDRTRRGVAIVLRQVVARLLKLRLAPPLGAAQVLYGDLKPEHVLFPDGPDELPVFIDPGLQRGPEHADAAKLVSRTALTLIAAPPISGTTAVLDGVDAVVQEQLRPMGRALRGLYLRRLLVTWLMDTTNIATTFLSAPAGLLLPEHAGSLIERIEAVCTLLDRVSALLLADADSAAAWRLALNQAAKAALR
ncbi:phosphotransferase [Streptomyces acidiscabies]|uniref:Phosphotransferase n=1 Tax=Streptomyces acidiscabies TaxID=42234 RepID=A0ABU4MBZ7_9ACTN|nr:phosphotransferase [Streptomyces acidiscabies]MDX3024975.1 phosphotransferase [Streptomyces acidiscabies]